MSKHLFLSFNAGLLALALQVPAFAQNAIALEKITSRANNRPLASLAAAAAEARSRRPVPAPPREVPNFNGAPPAPLSGPGTTAAPTAVVQTTQGTGTTSPLGGFKGASNNDNGRLLGFLVAPPDTDGQVGASHYVQMVNLLTTIYDKAGNKVVDSFPSNVIWSDIGGNCQAYNQGDPIVLYDETVHRWVFSQFAFDNNLTTFSQCVAISTGSDPLGGYNRYEFPFDGIGFNDYPKHGIVSNSITMTANLFRKRGPFFNFAGTFLGVIDKNAMYAGTSASLIGFNIGTSQFGFVAGDLDGTGTNVPALFATAMSQSSLFDIWRVNIDWGAPSNASASRIASIPISSFDSDLCPASREACIPQPANGPALEAMSDRLMHRLQIRDTGNMRKMVAAHTVDVGNGRAGIRWYEFRESTGTWSLHQEGTFAPNDGLHRWMPSIAMNAGGDIGIGYLRANTNTFVSTAVAGQSASKSGSGQLDSSENVCAVGSGVQTGTARAGDYSSTSVDPTNDSFWHTNEVFNETGQFKWDTRICNFTVGSGTTNNPPTASFTSSCNNLTCTFTSTSTDSDGSIASYSWNFGDGAIATGQTVNQPSHTYAGGGTYNVSLTVTDNLGATGSTQQSVTVSSGGITLSVRGYKVKGLQKADLTWSGASGTSVAIIRNGDTIVTTLNDGSHTDNIDRNGGGTYVYKVCEAGSSNCSNNATVVF